MKYTITLIIAVVLVAVGVLIYASVRSDKNESQQESQSQQNSVVDAPKKGVKRFSLTAKVDGVTGDGSITLKEDLTSMAVRLIQAPTAGSDEDYEVYVIPSEGEPILAGPMISVNSPNEKYLWAGAGSTAWFDAKGVMVTKRTKTAAKPGTIVAQSDIPKDSIPGQ